MTRGYTFVIAAGLLLASCSTAQQQAWNTAACEAQAAANAFTDATAKTDPQASAASAVFSAVAGAQCAPLPPVTKA